MLPTRKGMHLTGRGYNSRDNIRLRIRENRVVINYVVTVATQPEGVVVSDQEILARAQAQLLGAMALLETLDNKQELTEGGNYLKLYKKKF